MNPHHLLRKWQAKDKRTRKNVKTFGHDTDGSTANDPVNRMLFSKSIPADVNPLDANWIGDNKLATEDVTKRSATDPQYSAHVRTKLATAAGIVQTFTLRLQLEFSKKN